MEERRDLLPFLKKGDIVFFWKGYDIWKLAIFDEVIEDGRYAFITKVDPYQRMKLTPERLWRYINFPRSKMSTVPASQRADGDFNIMDMIKKNEKDTLQAQTEARDAEAKAAELEKEKLKQAKKAAESEAKATALEAQMKEWMDAMAAKGIDVSTLPPLGRGQSNIATGSSSQVKFSNVPAGEKSGDDTTGAGAPPGPGAQ